MDILQSFSIIIPCRNAGRTLEKCIKALLASDYPAGSFEIIVSDDRSTDNSLEIARSYPVKIAETRQKSGPGGARNRGAELASNECLIFLDSDIIVEQETLAKFNAAINRYPAYTVIQAIYGAGDYKTSFSRFQQNWFSYFYTLRENYPTGTLSTSCIAIKKSDFMDAGKINPHLRTNEDTEFGYRLALEGGKILICTDIEVFHDSELNLKTFIKRNFFIHNFMLVRLTYGMADIRSGNPEYDVPVRNLALSGLLLLLLALLLLTRWPVFLLAILLLAGHQLWMNRKFFQYVGAKSSRLSLFSTYCVLQLDSFVKLAGLFYGSYEYFVLRKHRMIRRYAARHGVKI